ncbi:MAG: FtsX-like permease family protein, partial [Firmicutes bacterium]|nr:FtsX-like permease family protein [Bacillota bacterium]
ISLVFVGFTMLLLTNFIMASLSANKKFMGIMRSMGASTKDMFGIFACESGVAGAVIFAVSFVVSSIIVGLRLGLGNTSFLFSVVPPSLWRVSIVDFLVMLGVVAATTFLAVFVPIVKKSRTPIVNIIKKG